jgi:para-nitrobenzyl esterase
MKMRLGVLFAVFLAACAGAAPAAVVETNAPVVRTLSTGAVAGREADGVQVWRAVPFAAPPVGAMRWRAPRPPAPWSGVRDATAPSPWCPQILSALDGVSRSRWGELVGQEDCLFLDVYAPAQASTTQLPVMVWIHGGSNVWGRAEQYDPSELVRRQNVIVVVAQYRLGPLGWFAHESLRAGGGLPEDASPNFGTLDTIRALEWVRDEIAVFGGDPNLVTVFGESAGGQNVAALLASPRARGLFHRAIVQSGSFRSTPLAEAEGTGADARADSGRAVATRLLAGRSITGEALREVPLDAVFAAYDTARGAFDPPRIIADGLVLPAEGLERVDVDVPIMLGSNRDETKLFNALSPELSRRVLWLFPQARDPDFYDAVSSYQSRMWRATAVDAPARRITEAGNAAVFTYRFDWDDMGGFLFTDLGELLGAAHAMEIPFVFGRFEMLGAMDRFAFTRANEAERLELSSAMMSYWANFARTGAPGRGVDGRLPEWGVANAEGRIMILDSASSGGVRTMNDVETTRRIVADLFADPRLESDAEKCRVFRATERWNPELAGADGARCVAEERG